MIHVVNRGNIAFRYKAQEKYCRSDGVYSFHTVILLIRSENDYLCISHKLMLLTLLEILLMQFCAATSGSIQMMIDSLVLLGDHMRLMLLQAMRVLGTCYKEV
jgi:hypothetical protein